MRVNEKIKLIVCLRVAQRSRDGERQRKREITVEKLLNQEQCNNNNNNNNNNDNNNNMPL